jgi:hypothetical protein
MKDDMAALEKVQALKFQMRQRAVVSLLKREQQLRADIAKLEEQSRAVDQTDAYGMELIGADMIWRAWVGRSKSVLNVELAQVLAQKETVIRGVRREFGKLSVARQLAKDHAETRKRHAAELQLRQAIEQSVFRRNF